MNRCKATIDEQRELSKSSSALPVHQADWMIQKEKKFEQLLFELSTSFIALPPEQANQAIHGALERIGHLLSFERCSIDRLSADGREMIITHVWMKSGSVEKEGSARYVLKLYPNFLSGLFDGQPKSWRRTDSDLLELTKEESQFLDTTGAKAFVAIPVIAVKSLKICLTCTSHSGGAIFDKLVFERLQLLASLIANVLFHKNRELELRQRAAQLNRAQALVHIGHWELDPFTNKVSGSDELFRIFGLPHNECTLDAFVAVIHPDDRDFLLYHIQRGVDHGKSWGLATVLGIVEQNGGRIEVSSEPGQGSAFSVYFPCVHRRSKSKSDSAKSRQPIGGEETILVVEDEEMVRQLAQKLLTHLGYQVLAAGSPGDAIIMVERYEGKIDLLLTDVIMPHLNGHELAIRLLEMRPDLKVLYTSGYTQNVIGHHGVLDKGVHFLSKPYSLNTLGVRVRDVLDS